MTRRPMFPPKPLTEDQLATTFLRRPGRPEPRDAVNRDERVKRMPDLQPERVYRDLGDCLALMGIGAFLGALLTLALERIWLP